MFETNLHPKTRDSRTGSVASDACSASTRPQQSVTSVLLFKFVRNVQSIRNVDWNQLDLSETSQMYLLRSCVEE